MTKLETIITILGNARTAGGMSDEDIALQIARECGLVDVEPVHPDVAARVADAEERAATATAARQREAEAKRDAEARAAERAAQMKLEAEARAKEAAERINHPVRHEPMQARPAAATMPPPEIRPTPQHEPARPATPRTAPEKDEDKAEDKPRDKSK